MSNFMTHNLSRLATFKGRETRAQFWPYVGIIFLLQMAASFVISTIQMQPMMQKAQAFVLAHPELASGANDPGQYTEAMKAESVDLAHSFADVFSGMAVGMAAVVVVVALLYATAVVRRLHDRNMSGGWGLLPVPFLAFGLAVMPRVMDSVGPASHPNLRLIGLMFLNNMIYLATLVTLIILLAKPGDPAFNRYGPPTDA